jgi:hypothetical protein
MGIVGFFGQAYSHAHNISKLEESVMRNLLLTATVVLFSSFANANAEQANAEALKNEKVSIETMRQNLGAQAKRKSDAEVKVLWDEKMQSVAKMAK